MVLSRAAWPMVFLTACVMVCAIVALVHAADRDRLGGSLITLVRPGESPDDPTEDRGYVERILSIPLIGHAPREQQPWAFRQRGLTSGNPSPAGPSGGEKQLTRLAPGMVLAGFHERWSELASIRSPVLSPRILRDGFLDVQRSFDGVGKLAGNPDRLYDRLEVRVNRSNFKIHLLGFRGDEGRVLYSSKVGLGSREFPTPRGSYYLCRIYDDHPLWIPPKDREWAYGMRPSRSVYGGHMMPFFSKRSIRGSGPDTPGLDKIEPKVRMIDFGAYRIHGTDSPWSVGDNQSHGCVRMRNATVAKLSDAIKMYAGTTVRGESPNGKYVDLARPVKLILR